MIEKFLFWKYVDVRQYQRHWPSLVAAAITFGLGYAIIWKHIPPDQETFYGRWAVVSALGISLFLAVTLTFAQSLQRNIAIALGFVGLAIFGSLPNLGTFKWPDELYGFRMVQAGLLFHLLVSLAPLFHDRLNGVVRKANDEKVFWGRNWFWMTRIQMAGAQSILLMFGTFAAFFSVQKLFELHSFSDKTYLTISLTATVLCSALLFIGSLGEEPTRENPMEPPILLRKVVRTVFTPLSIAYLGILYAYAGKLIVQHRWPEGMIGFMVAGLALMVTLSYAIMRPLTESGDFSPRLKTFWNWSFRLLIPPLILLMFAIGRRTSEYGWTQDRVALGILTLWTFGIAIYYWNPTRRSLSTIPLSLAIVALVTWFGPLSPASLGLYSQTSRLRKLLNENPIEMRSTLNADSPAVIQINEALRYICRMHGTDAALDAAQIASSAIARDKLPAKCERYGWDATHPLHAVTHILQIPFLGPATTTYTAESKSYRFQRRTFGSSARFQDHDFVSLNLPSRSRSDDEDTNTGAGLVRFRFSSDTGILEWNPTNKDSAWQKIDLTPVADRLREYERTRNRGQQSEAKTEMTTDADGRIGDTFAGGLAARASQGNVEVEIQIDAITYSNFNREKPADGSAIDPDKVSNITFSALAHRKKP